MVKTQNHSGKNTNMSDPFNQQAQSLVLENHEVQACDGETPRPQSSSEPDEEEDDIHYLTEKPFFDLIIAKSHLIQLYLPISITPSLPKAAVPVVLTHGGKNWNLSYVGNAKSPRFDPRWKIFVTENQLKLGDACVFELVDDTPTNPRFKVHIYRLDDFPIELLELIESRGQTFETPICID